MPETIENQLRQTKRELAESRKAIANVENACTREMLRAEKAERELAEIKTTMMAAAVEITDHWDAHCNEEGYGPANLVHRLEAGLTGGGYAYTAKDWVVLHNHVKDLKEELKMRERKTLTPNEMSAALNRIALKGKTNE